jgi:hypothetical protein
MKKLIVAATIAAFGAAVILPAIGSFDSAYAATNKKKKKTAKKPATTQPATKPATKM